MTFKFSPRQVGIDALANSAGVATLVNANAQRVLNAAKADSGPDDNYNRSLRMEDAAPTSDGMTAKVIADSPFWHLFEFGSVKNPPMRVLSRAVTTAGLKFRDDR